MTTLRIAKKVHFIVCDDVRQEVGNKLSLMGVYNELILPKLPIVLRSLTIVIFLEHIITAFPKIIIDLQLPGDEAKEFTIDTPKGANKGKDAKLILGISPIPIKNEGEADIILRLPEDKERKIKHSFKIKLADKKK